MKAHLLHIHTVSHADHVRIEEILLSVLAVLGRAICALVWLVPLVSMFSIGAFGCWALVGWLEKLAMN